MAKYRIDDPTNNFVVDAGGPNSASGGLWGNAPLLAAAITDPESYVYLFDDFKDFNDSDGWVATQATAGTVASVQAEGGTIAVDCNSTTADQGMQIQSNIGLPAPAADKTTYFEARVKVEDSIANAQIFVGLAAADTTIFASGAVSASDFVGWVQDAADIAASASKLRCQSSSGTVAESSTTDITNGTYIKLGFRLNGVSTMDVFVNGTLTEVVDISGTNVAPETVLYPSFACLSEGTTDPILTVDWVKALGER